MIINLRFDGVFRDYQKNVLEHANQYLKDGKIHIVAAPGSGKTTLGIELICRLGNPALILSPTVTIRQQWGERIKNNFLSSDQEITDYLSYDLHRPSHITSITYQALYAAFNKLSICEENDDDTSEKTDIIDFSDFDLLDVIKKANIKTICLDEAHHLKNEWHKALQCFINAIGNQVAIISLTATPPYDSTPSEWKKYTDLCGEIDEEIYVPQLVAQKNLCPHQDYIYFNYPTNEETQIFNQYKKKAITCTEEILQSQLFDDALLEAGIPSNFKGREVDILDHENGYIALLSMAKHRGMKLPKQLIKLLFPSGKLPAFSLLYAETAFQFILDTPTIFSSEVSLRLNKILSENALIEKKKVQLKSNDQVKKMLLSSMGKLDSINKIVQSESSNLKENLRMLILTDYIKKDLVKIIGSDDAITTMGTVPIFESIRRSCSDQVRIAVLSGTLVIIHKEIQQEIEYIAKAKNVLCTSKMIGNTDYLEVTFSGSNKNKVDIMTQAFSKGLFQVLVGTKSLLGEGWDSPCINSLILASFIGSYVFSNQMRGRAIRVDENQPEKVSNIWHLVTLEPPLILESKMSQLLSKPLLDEDTLESDDYSTLERRFHCFLAPAYSKDIIENGIERLDIIKPPFNQCGISQINEKMLALSTARETVKSRWDGTVCGLNYSEIQEMNEIPKSVQPKGFLWINFIQLLIMSIGINFCTISGFIALKNKNSFSEFVVGIFVAIILVYICFVGFFRIVRYFSPKKTIVTLSTCILSTLKDIGEIESKEATVKTISDNSRSFIYCCLTNATLHDKHVFARAVQELLSSFHNPRYILVKSYGIGKLSLLLHLLSYGCPSVIATKKENVEILSAYLKKHTGKFSTYYTRNETGRKVLIKCRKRSYININEAIVKNKRVVNDWD